MNILDLVNQDGLTPKKIASTSGGEYQSACPICDGNDRFRCWPEEKDGGRFWCRGCGIKGDRIDYLRSVRGMEYREAAAYIGKPVKESTVRPAFTNKAKPKPPEPDTAEKYYQVLLKDAGAQSYLQGRGITLDTAKKFSLGLCSEKSGRWLTIPHKAGGKLANIKYRSLPPAEKTFRRIPGAASVLFNGDCLPGLEEVFLTEGEIDAITLIQAEIENVVSGTTGAGSFDAAWIEQLRHIKKIFIVYDQDQAGQDGARKLARRLGYNRCWNVELPPGQDLNDFFQSNDKSAFQSLVHEAERFELPGVITFTKGLELYEVDREKPQLGLLTPWDGVNRLTKGFHPGDLIILSADPKTGKTTFALQIASALALKAIPTLFFCLEMRAERLINKFLQAHYQTANPGQAELQRARNELDGMPLYFAHSFKKEKLEDVIELIRDAIRLYDLRLVVFDHLHFLIRSIANVNEELGLAIQAFKLLAEEMEIPILALAQPRKRENERQIMTGADIKGSSAFLSDCDQMLILFRERQASKPGDIKVGANLETEAFSPITLVRMEANRYGAGGETLLRMIGDQSRFIESDQKKS